MKNSVEKSVVLSLDGTDIKLFPYLPYIFQDLWELGTSPKVILNLLKKHTKDQSKLKILDLGCGKGAVSISLAKELNCMCNGIDAVQEFIDVAINKAKKCNIEKYCLFECSDIRVKARDLKGCDVIILGAIGSVFGDCFSTLTRVSKCIKESGLIIIDDAYIDDESEYSHPLIYKRSEILKQISETNMILIDEILLNKDDLIELDNHMYKNIRKRCKELIERYPVERNIFVDYLKSQEEENELIETKLISSTMLIGNSSFNMKTPP